MIVTSNMSIAERSAALTGWGRDRATHGADGGQDLPGMRGRQIGTKWVPAVPYLPESFRFCGWRDGLRPEQPTFTDFAALIRLEVERAVAAAEVQLRSERQVGLLLRGAPLDRGGRPPANRSKDTTGFVGLPECGLTKDLSARCRRLAAIDEETFESYLASSRSRLRAATAAGALRAARAVSGKPPTPRGACTRAVQRFGRLLTQARRLAQDFGLEEQVTALKAADRLRRGLDATFAPETPLRMNNAKGVT